MSETRGMSGTGARLLVVDDEVNIRELLGSALRFAGFQVSLAADGVEAVSLARRDAFDLILMDVMMPRLDGFGAVGKLRAENIQVPVLFLTAKDDLTDKVAGLTVGGDDYVTKPFSLEELVARIRAQLRRNGVLAGSKRTTTVAFEELVLDPDAHQVHYQGVELILSPTEFKLLRYLMEHPKMVLSKSQILDHVWSYDFHGEANVVESYISYLRKKLEAAAAGAGELIQTVRGVGYVLRALP